ncbi:MAG: c-type cytochrome [Maricaulaceae bacterium]|jgi:hypothetical protein
MTAHRSFIITGAAIAAVVLAACGEMEGIGFALPPGDADAGRAVFVDMACADCHSVVGDEALRTGVTLGMDVPLGGPTSRIRTYGELVTSVINPSHRISEQYQTEEFTRDGESRMSLRYYNQVMTVDELIDVVTFLQSKYELVEYPSTPYSQYQYPGYP